MLRIHGLAAALLLTACSAQETPSEAPDPAANTAAAPIPSPSPTPAEARKVKESGELIEFGYGWPAEAEALPQLRARLEGQLVKDRTEATGQAETDRRERQEGDFPFNPHGFEKNWAVSGDTPSLLSLLAEIYTFTGGAHGNTGYETLLWDKTTDSEIARDLVLPAALLTRLTPAYCRALDQAREEKRGGQLPEETDSPFTACPPIANQALAPTDTDGDRLFDAIGIVLGPYEAGPYAEGSYELQLPVDAGTLAAIPEAYRAAFEVKR